MSKPKFEQKITKHETGLTEITVNVPHSFVASILAHVQGLVDETERAYKLLTGETRREVNFNINITNPDDMSEYQRMFHLGQKPLRQHGA